MCPGLKGHALREKDDDDSSRIADTMDGGNDYDRDDDDDDDEDAHN